MIFTASRGQAFAEEFHFKNEAGQPLVAPAGEYVLTLERGGVVKQFTNLHRTSNSITWKLTADETRELEYNTLYFTLALNGQEIARGVLRVQ